jgi:citrate lyase subunit beta/citryl-CoA lyase
MATTPGTMPLPRRSWLFLPGADRVALLAAAVAGGADVLIQELEDFTPPARRDEARALAPEIMAAWHRAGRLVAARINPFETVGREDLPAVMRGRPHVVMMSKVVAPAQVAALDQAIGAIEAELSIPAGTTEIVPNIESAAGLVRTVAIAEASPRVTACLVASEDMVTDLGAERSREGGELAYVRARFLVECRAANVLAIDCPYTFSDLAGLETETLAARRLGYQAKSLVAPGHAALVNRLLTPAADELRRARRLVAAFEAAVAEGRDRVELDGRLVEVPTYSAAKRLLARAAALGLDQD